MTRPSGCVALHCCGAAVPCYVEGLSPAAPTTPAPRCPTCGYEYTPGEVCTKCATFAARSRPAVPPRTGNATLLKLNEVLRHLAGAYDLYDGALTDSQCEAAKANIASYEDEIRQLFSPVGRPGTRLTDAALSARPSDAQDIDTLYPREEYGDDDGNVLWWTLPVTEPPYCGRLGNDDCPEYVTHWSRLHIPLAATPQERDA